MKSIYAEPRLVSGLEECSFYHTMDIPGWGMVKGQWDLRDGVDEYLGGVEFKGRRVLEIGTADGFFTFQLESLGAEVVSYDLSEDFEWDTLPPHIDRRREPSYRSRRRKLNNGYWLAHQAFNSRARVVYGTAYQVPEEIGPVDVATFGSVLLHLRDPFLALERVLRLTTQTVIVTDLFRDPRTTLYNRPPAGFFSRNIERMRRRFIGPSMLFLPSLEANEAHGIWWYLTPEIIQRFLDVLGFEKTTVTFHQQSYVAGNSNVKIPLYTVVGNRTRPAQ